MADVFLFDWGDTLMIDFPEAQGKMCHWDTVEAVENAEETLKYLSENAEIYIATGTADSSEADIKAAFERVGLSRYISGYFCKDNIGLSKGSCEFYQTILDLLGKDASKVAMVGDSLQKDIIPASSLGIQAYWLTSTPSADLPKNTKLIRGLIELCA